MARLLIFIFSALLTSNASFAEEGSLYKKKVTYKTIESTKHPGYIELALNGDKTISKTTISRLQFLQIGMICKEKHFHAMIENLPEEGKGFTVIRCKADDVADDKDKKEAGIIPHKKEILEYCEPKDPKSNDENNWIADVEIKKMCDKYKKLLAKTKS